MDYVRYLRSKTTVDDRALNLRVLQAFENHVKCTGPRSPSHPLRVVELGAGIGSMFTRLQQRDVMFSSHDLVEYILVDVKEEVLRTAQEDIGALSIEPRGFGYEAPCLRQTRTSSISGAIGVHVSGVLDDLRQLGKVRLSERISVDFVLGDALEYLKRNRGRFDVVIAAAVLDLWEVAPALRTIIDSLNTENGVNALYFPINFDGTTDFFPASSEGSTFDTEVQNAFHLSMGYRRTGREKTMACHTGRRLIPALKDMRLQVHSLGSSAWVVSPRECGSYTGDEAFFLHCILEFIESTVVHSQDGHSQIDTEAAKRYISSRKQQVAEGRLIYVAHNLDFFCTS